MKGKGFTLIEVMVVIAIIALLAMISVPSIMRYLSKAKRTEAHVNLRALYTAQKAHWAEHGTYLSALGGPNSVGWQPEGYAGGGARENFYYTYGFPGAEGINYFTGSLQTPASFLSKAQAGKTGFLALAVGDIDGDGKPDILAIDHMGKIVILEDDLAD
jgi:prepilin-type N-terminal cleavage/methylation domain-containing protein